ncbi:hypothetical protein HOK31_08540 [Candidatus Poribacteria bacterium]|nr:hypothetical protein [Candidatus Poribacteria bacterium]
MHAFTGLSILSPGTPESARAKHAETLRARLGDRVDEDTYRALAGGVVQFDATNAAAALAQIVHGDAWNKGRDALQGWRNDILRDVLEQRLRFR